MLVSHMSTPVPRTLEGLSPTAVTVWFTTVELFDVIVYLGDMTTQVLWPSEALVASWFNASVAF
jgi:hypothetical protein